MLYGSPIRSAARRDSGLAALVAGYADPLGLGALAGNLPGLAGCPCERLC